jgi:hypothetical protein
LAAFSPDGAWVVIEAADGLRAWDLRRLRAGLVAEAPPWRSKWVYLFSGSLMGCHFAMPGLGVTDRPPVAVASLPE